MIGRLVWLILWLGYGSRLLLLGLWVRGRGSIQVEDAVDSVRRAVPGFSRTEAG